MKLVISWIFAAAVAGCSGNSFTGGLNGSDEKKKTEDVEGEADSEDDQANEPVMVNGAFLTLGCRKMSDFSSLPDFSGFTSVYQCGIHHENGSIYTESVTDPACHHAEAGEAKTLVQTQDSTFHFYLGFQLIAPTDMSSLSCQVNAGGQAVTFEKATGLPEKQPDDVVPELPVPELGSVALHLPFAGETCQDVAVNTLGLSISYSTSNNNNTKMNCVDGFSGNAFKFDGSSSLKLGGDKQLIDFWGDDYQVSFQLRGDPGEENGPGMVILETGPNLNDPFPLAIEVCTSEDCAGSIRMLAGKAGNAETVSVEKNVLDGKWHEVSVRRIGDTMTLSVDKIQASFNLSTPGIKSGSSFRIGGSYLNERLFEGEIDEFKMATLKPQVQP